MAKTINGITFNDLSRIGKGSAFANIKNGDVTDESELQDFIDAGEEYRNIQSVLIDWNAANIGSRVSSLNAPEGISHSTITTTGELLDEIAHLRAQVDALTSLVKGLYNALA